jgi:N12 class adenine-specific DNA methylase
MRYSRKRALKQLLNPGFRAKVQEYYSGNVVELFGFHGRFMLRRLVLRVERDIEAQARMSLSCVG